MRYEGFKEDSFTQALGHWVREVTGVERVIRAYSSEHAPGGQYITVGITGYLNEVSTLCTSYQPLDDDTVDITTTYSQAIQVDINVYRDSGQPEVGQTLPEGNPQGPINMSAYDVAVAIQAAAMSPYTWEKVSIPGAGFREVISIQKTQEKTRQDWLNRGIVRLGFNTQFSHIINMDTIESGTIYDCDGNSVTVTADEPPTGGVVCNTEA